MPAIMRKIRALLQFYEYVFSTYELDLAFDSTCPMSMNRQRKSKDGKLKKQASMEEAEAQTSEEEAKEPSRKRK